MTHRRTVRVLGPLPPPVHGASAVTQRMVDALRERREVGVVTVDIGDGASTLRRLLTMLLGLGRLLPSLVRRRPDTLYLGGAGGELLWYQAIVVLLGRLAGHRTVFHHHNSSYLTTRMASMDVLVRCGGARLEHVVLSDDMGRRLQQRYPAARSVRVCSNAGLMAAATPGARDDDAEGPIVLGHLSNLTLEKGVAVAIESLRRLLADGVDARLVLAGPCIGDDVETLVADAVSELSGRLESRGLLDAAQVEQFYRSIDLFVFPSTYANEAEPLVVLDALRHGVPAIAHDVGCLAGMLPPDHVVPVGADLPAVVSRLVRHGALETGASAAARFDARRGAAVEARRELVDLLVG